MSGQGIIGTIISIFIAIVLITAFYPVILQLNPGFAILFVILSLLVVSGVILSIFKK